MVIKNQASLHIPQKLLMGLLWSALAFFATLFYTPSLSLAKEDSHIPFPEGSSTPALNDIAFLQEETVSIAALHEQPVSQAPSNVYVITAEDIRHSGATDLPTLLRRVPGMEVIQRTGAHYDVSVRGDNQTRANKLLLMVDGRSIFIDVQGLVFWKALPVTLPEIKRIEVLKGPASAVYGFNAFDGVINIITKSPEDMPGTTVQVRGGEFGTFTGSAIQAGRYKSLGYRLSVERDQNQQFRNRSALAFRSHKFNVQTDYPITALSSLKVEGGFMDVNRFDGPNGNIQRFNNSFTQGYARMGYNNPNFFVHAFWNRWDAGVDNHTRPSLAPFILITDKNGRSENIPFVSNTYDVETQYAWKFGSIHRLTSGLNLRHNTLSSSETTGFGRETRFGMYLQEEWRPVESFAVTAGVRVDLHNAINPTYSPRLVFFFTPVPDQTFRLSGSLAFRPPTLAERKVQVLTNTNIFGVKTTNTTLGSGNLDPEQIISYEAEYQGWFLRHRLQLRGALFFNHLSDLIGAVATSPTTGTFFNQGEADIYGGEAGGEMLITPWLSGFANVAYQDIGQTITGQRRGAPRVKINGGLRGDWENGLNAEAVVHYVGSATYPVDTTFATFANLGLIAPSAVPNPHVRSYTLLNLRGGYRFWNDKAEASVSVFNALNDRHREHPLGDVIGSRVTGWLTINF